MEPEQPRLDRTILTFEDIDQPDGMVDYWWSRTAEERFAGIQALRETFYGIAASARLLRILEFVEQE